MLRFFWIDGAAWHVHYRFPMNATQLKTIAARRIDNTARAMMRNGVTLTHEQSDTLGEEGMAWIRTRLGLVVRTTDTGVVCEVVS